MKSLLLIVIKIFILTLTVFSDQSHAKEGEILFSKKGCAGCHSKSFDSFAPSLKTISKSYRDKKVELTNYLRGKSPGIIHREPKTMKKIITNVTKKLDDRELESLINYLLSH